MLTDMRDGNQEVRRGQKGVRLLHLVPRIAALQGAQDDVDGHPRAGKDRYPAQDLGVQYDTRLGVAITHDRIVLRSGPSVIPTT